MANKDQTGPFGKGPLTGRGMGVCQGFPMPRFAKTRMGHAMGFGQRQGYRHRFYLAGLLPGCAYLTYRLFNRKKH
ncbi:hypothetical protein CLNEO_24450 [Anaerotignum neopropionicum]|uniref:DUF5320 domain-containing protein n=1 Tax=Anaerotignum neopropionicum TaxID=36847 RepID=A0A136WCC9_9FIRM|nr:DUF5320 domain-containing protein [Anaerotignum neopropionicum]KXL52096.1 hypothetical protein CLNEO_24450 [Anaerotignum neopropionicum]